MNDILISIILPVYNVEKYLNTCVDSIISSNNLSDVEILLINDGSTDNSGAICDDLMRKYNCISTYHKVNGGLSDARNFGLNKAKGRYVLFIDSDDYLVDGAINLFRHAAMTHNTEIILWDAQIVDEYGNKIENQSYEYIHKGLKNEHLYTGEEVISLQLSNYKDFVTTVWLGMYSRSLLLSNEFWFEKSILHEDELWTPKVLLAAKRVLYLEKKMYSYRVRPNSIMNCLEKNYKKNLESLIYIYSSLPHYYSWKLKDKELCVRLKDNVAKRYLHSITKYGLHMYPELFSRVSRFEIIKCSRSIKNICRATVLLCSRKIYGIVSSKFKKTMT